MKTPRGDFIHYIKPSGTIAAIKLAVQAMQGIPPENQRVMLNRVPLEDTRTLGYYGVRNGAILPVAMKVRVCSSAHACIRETDGRVRRCEMCGFVGLPRTL